MYNYVMLVGRLAKDPVLRELKDGKKVVELVLAVQRGFKDYNGEQTVDYIPVTVWEALAEASSEYLTKGKMILAKGRITPKKELDTLVSGATVQNYFVTADKIVFLSGTTKKKEEDQI